MSSATRPRLVLASASPARLRLLRGARFDPEVVVSGVDEEAFVADGVDGLVLALAKAKATAVHESLGAGPGSPSQPRRVVLGCDSMFELDERAESKPGSNEAARARLRAARGRTGVLRTGHCLIDDGGRTAAAVASTTVRFGDYSDEELDAYLATGEALEVAGGFTLDGRSGPFIDGVDGDPSNVIGLSLPLFRRLLGELGLSVVELWA